MPKFFLLFLFFCATQIAAAQSPPAQSQWNTEADYDFKTRILATHLSIPHNNQIQALIEFDLKNWKIYGQNPGSTGLPTTFTIEASDNIQTYDIIYPPTETLNILGTQTNGYQKHVTFPINITVKDSESPVTINATANFLACNTLCIPTTHKFSLTLPPTPPGQTATINPIATLPSPPSPLSGQQNIWVIIVFFSVLGGLILNIMPCVLPAIGLKAFAISNHPDRISVRKSCLATAAGIITCFAILGGALMAIKFFGAEIGWGIQYQQPAFLSLLFMVMVIFSATLMEWTPALPTLPALSTGNSSTLKQDFMLGVLATVLATPCSAPFLSTAVAAAMIVGGGEALLIFTALGFGMSLPYLLMAAFPGAVRVIPKPGRWMMTVKSILALLLLLTGVWLLWLLASSHSLMIAAIVGVLGFVAVGYLYVRKKDIFVFKTPAALLPGFLVIGAFLLGLSPPPAAPSPPHSDSVAQISAPQTYNENIWQNFDEAEIDSLVSEGKIIFVDVTADWCVTCQFNKFRVLKNDKIAGLLLSEGIVPMRADWTLPDDSITRYLRKHGRVGVPMNVIYGPAVPEGLVLPEILSVPAVLSALKKAGS